MKVFDQDGKPKLALLHCRADRLFALDRLAKHPAVKSTEGKKANFEEQGDGSVGYGLINPFTAEHSLGLSENLIQIFDESIFDVRGSETGTMMTNAGDHTWAIEFNPLDLERLVDDEKFFRFDISGDNQDGTEPRVTSSKLAIITGNAPESGMLLWQKVNQECRRLKGVHFKGDISYPEVLIGSYPWMGLSMEIDVRSEHFKARLLEEVSRLSSMGADLFAAACNTTQVFEPEISQTIGSMKGEYCGLAGIVESWLQSRDTSSPVFIAGIGHVTNNTKYSAFRFLHEIDDVVLPTPEQSEQIIKLAFEVKQSGPTSKGNQKLRTILKRSGCNQALLLLTELSMVFEQFPKISSSEMKVTDALDLYAVELAGKLCRPHRPNYV